jgi:hypothetical protein
VTIAKGSSWGRAATTAEVAPDAPVAWTDAELARLVEEGHADRPVLLRGGDLHRTLGSPPPDRLHDGAMVFPLDVLEVRLDGGAPLLAVAHVVARRGGWWRHTTVAAMNACFVGELDLGPKAHPNDGLVDVTVGRLPLRDRRLARARMRSGTHVPHPSLRVARVPRWEAELDRPTPVLVDGVQRGAARHVAVEVVADAIRVVC